MSTSRGGGRRSGPHPRARGGAGEGLAPGRHERPAPSRAVPGGATGEQARGRRPLTNVGGPTRTEGEPRIAAGLAEAMELAAREDPDALTHGFHPWPARMHRAIARVVIAKATRPGERVLDPFCGSGTVLLEATLAGRRAAGVDLNPIAGPLVAVKCERRDDAAIGRFLETVMQVGEASVERVRARERAIAKLPPSMLGWYGPHVLKEMAGLLEEIRSVEDEGDRRAMEMVFSSLVVKLSKKKAETSEQETDKRIRKGLTTELFVRKCEELGERWHALARALPRDAIAPRVFQGDARGLTKLLGDRTKARLVLTSPPYGGTYDYHAQHALRLAWLGLDARGLAHLEIGARRSATVDEDEAAERWHHDVGAMLASIESVLAPDGTVVLLMGDGRFGRHRMPLIPQLLDLAPRVGLAVIASASQPRDEWGRGEVREEHLVALKKRQRPAPGRRPR